MGHQLVQLWETKYKKPTNKNKATGRENSKNAQISNLVLSVCVSWNVLDKHGEINNRLNKKSPQEPEADGERLKRPGPFVIHPRVLKPPSHASPSQPNTHPHTEGAKPQRHGDLTVAENGSLNLNQPETGSPSMNKTGLKVPKSSLTPSRAAPHPTESKARYWVSVLVDVSVWSVKDVSNDEYYCL